MSIKATIRRVVPDRLWKRLKHARSMRAAQRRLRSNFAYDERRFRTHSDPFRKLEDREHLRSYITMLFHSIEKGLVLPSPRPGFGRAKVNDLLTQIDRYLDLFGPDHLVSSALRALDAYVLFNADQNGAISIIKDKVEELKERDRNEKKNAAGGGYREMSRDEIWDTSRLDLQDFFDHRFSVRQFSTESVSDNDIRTAIRMAQKAPSVCNRQSGRVYVFDNDELGASVLACQQGNLGFGHQANKILVVTSDLGGFLSIGERNQSWIDGGLFAMALIFALHSLGLGTCPLNWSVERETDERLRDVAGIKDSENIIMLLAVGHLPERFKVAYSERQPVDEIARFRTSSQGAIASTRAAQS